LAASRLKGASAAQALVVRFGSILVPSVFVSISSDLLEQVKGWRHFDRGRGRPRADLAAASLIARKGKAVRGSPGQEPGDPAEKDRAIDPMSGKNASA
jgi:hypothetical protein